MFSVTDFFNILEYIRTGDSSISLDEVIKVLSSSEKANATALFNEKIDLSIFSSNDYKLLKNFLIDWYSAHNTIISTQRQSSDVFSLPKEHLNELCSSFGYNVELSGITKTNEANLFLDLVNLYKIKGTPTAIARILGYYGMNKIQVVEYWLKKNSSGNLIFEPSISVNMNPDGTTENIPLTSLNYSYVYNNDAHWMVTEEETLQYFENGDITFPIKSPFIGIFPYYDINEVILTVAMLQKKVIEEYSNWVDDSSSLPTNEVSISIYDKSRKFSVLESFLVCDYLIKSGYGVDLGTQFNKDFYCYDGTSETYTEIINLFNEYVSYVPSSRNDRDEKIAEFQSIFVKDSSELILIEFTTAETLLNSINSTLKSEIDNIISNDIVFETLSLCLRELSEWIQNNFGAAYSGLHNFIIGQYSLDYVKNIVNFFKPFRARILTMDSGIVLKNILMDSLIVDDSFIESPHDITFIDYETGNSNPGFVDDEYPSQYYIYSKTPVGNESNYRQISNIYVNSSGEIKVDYYDYETYSLKNLYSTPPIGSYLVTNIYFKSDSITGEYQLVVEYDENNIVEFEGTNCRVESHPLELGYRIVNLYLENETLGLVLVIDDGLVDPDNEDNYYSRTHFDQGSYFDIGITMDDVENYPIEEDLTENIEDHYVNSFDSTNGMEQDLEIVSGSDTILNSYNVDLNESLTDSNSITEMRYDGGFSDFDEESFFDKPFPADILNIEIISLEEENTFYPQTSLDDIGAGKYSSWNFDSYSSPTLYIGGITSGFFRFPNINIPQGATILEATLSFSSAANQSTSIDSAIYLFDLSDISEFQNSSELQDFIRLNAYGAATNNHVNWVITEEWEMGEYYISPDLKNVIQEVIDIPGWTSGNALMFIWKNYNGSTSMRLINTIDKYISDPTYIYTRPKLYIKWQ